MIDSKSKRLYCLGFILAILSCTFFYGQLHAQDLPDITEYATDFTQTLSQDDIQSLRTELSDFHREKGSQIVVVMIATTGDSAIEDYANALFRKSKIGRKNINDGVLVLIAKDDRHMRIEVGYGLEGAITDIYAQRIIDEQMTPEFKDDDYYEGIKNGVSSLEKLINGENLPPPKYHMNATINAFSFSILILTAFVLGILLGLNRITWKTILITIIVADILACIISLSPIPVFLMPFTFFPGLIGYIFGISKKARIAISCIIAYALLGIILNNYFNIKIGPLYIAIPFFLCFAGIFIGAIIMAIFGKHSSGGKHGSSSGWSSSSSDWDSSSSSSSSSDSFSGDGGDCGGGGASGSW